MTFPPLFRSPSQALVVGPGAVGLLLGWDMLHPRVVGYLGRSPLPLEVEIATELPLTQSASFIPRGARLAEAEPFLAALEPHPLAVLFCTPPEETHAAVSSLLQTTSLANRPDTVWIACGNGLLSSETEALLTRDPSWTLVRALVFAGALRTEEPRKTRVSHGGGCTVHYGVIHGYEPALNGRMIQWTTTNDIRREEVEKLFINLALARTIGQKLAPNASALERLEEIHPFASAFCSVFPNINLNESHLMSLVAFTARATGANINSVSAAWARGNHHPLLALLKDLSIQKQGDAAVDVFWQGVPRDTEGR